MVKVALIPARAGSTRCPGKNTRLLGGQPVITWTIAAAQHSGLFDRILVCSDDPICLDLARAQGVESRHRHPVCGDQPDIDWVRPILADVECSAFAILRPTSPFRTADTLRRAMQQFLRSDVHSVRAVELARQHPGKMWWWTGGGAMITPVCAGPDPALPYHSRPTQALPAVYVQNSSLEIAWRYVVTNLGTISGTKVMPFFTQGHEGFTIDTEADWAHAEQIAGTL